jgi:hypothetical protein
VSCDVDPGYEAHAPRDLRAEIERRLSVAADHARSGTLLIHQQPERATTALDYIVRLKVFAEWSSRFPRPWSLPPDFPTAASPPAERAAAQANHAKGWPWGTYETPLLKELAAAAEHFWADEPDAKSAPTNDDVSEWLVKRGIASKRNGDAIARILLRPGLPPGPREKKFKKK